jgi:hypothetical protein
MCNCFEVKLQEINIRIRHLQNVSDVHSSWSDIALNLKENSEIGVSLQSSYKIENSSNPLQEIKNNTFFIPFSYCPFCGETLLVEEPAAVLSEQELEDKEAFATFTKLEEDLEERFGNITVKNLSEAYDICYLFLEQINLAFTVTKFNEENRMLILYKGHFDDHSIEIFLEADEDEGNIYTVTVF